MILNEYKNEYKLCNISMHLLYFPTNMENVASQTALMTVNICSSLFGTIANSLIIMAYYRNPRLRTIQNKIFLQLAFTDFGVTAFAQTMYVIATINGFLGNNYCILWGLTTMISLLLVEMSLITIFILSLQSYITLAYPYHWQSIITKQRLKIVFGISWTLILIKTLAIPANIKFAQYGAFFIALLTVITVIFTWTWTCKLVARHRNVIQSIQTPSSENVKKKKIVRSTITALAVMSSLLACYFLHLCLFIFGKYLNASRLGHDTYGRLWSMAVTMAYLNSLLNPCLLFWRSTPFREAVKNI